MTYSDLLHLNDAQGEVTGRHYTAQTRTVPGLIADVSAALVKAGDPLTSAVVPNLSMAPRLLRFGWAFRMSPFH
jgi:hypothetical protein